MAQVQATLRKRILRAFVARGLLGKAAAKEMLAWFGVLAPNSPLRATVTQTKTATGKCDPGQMPPRIAFLNGCVQQGTQIFPQHHGRIDKHTGLFATF